MTDQALAKVKVLDLSHYMAGPYCTRMLAGFGADVIKIEKPGKGDETRSMGPFLKDEPGPERSGLFLYLNNNKKGITLNLKSKMGVKIFKALVRDADVLVESFRPGVMEDLGLGYRTLEKINPGLVMTSVSNFGQTGPYRDYKSSHLIAWSMSGGRYIDGEQGQRPVQGGGWLTHYFGGLHALIGTTTALYQSNETGIGQHVDTSIMESTIMSNAYPATMYSYVGEVHHSICRAYLGIFHCKDGYIAPMLLTLAQWELMCAFFEVPELTADPRFENLGGILENFDEVKAIFEPLIKKREKMELFNSGTEWRIPFAQVPTTEDILQSPQHKARGFFEEADHPVMGKVTMPGAPFKLTETPWQQGNPAPLLGEHNREVYCERLKYSEDDLVKMRGQGVI